MSKRGGSRKKVSRLVPHYCEVPGCGYTTTVQKHRINPGREGGSYVLGNVIALCPNHHSEADKGMLPHDYLYYLVQERILRGTQEEYQSYIRGDQRSPTPGPSFAEEPDEGGGISNGNGTHVPYSGDVAKRFISYLYVIPGRPVPKRSNAIDGARKFKIGEGDGRVESSQWVYAKTFNGGRG